MLILNCLILVFIAFSVSLLLTPVVRNLALRIGAVDKPGARKIHVVAVPRLGGVGVVLALCLTVLTAHGLVGLDPALTRYMETWSPVIIGGIIVFLTGVWDDLRPLPVWLKFLFQALAACVAIWSDIRLEYISALGDGVFSLGMFAIPLTLLWIVGLTNAFNLIDGLDGLATGLGLIAAVTSATIFFIGGEVSDGLLLLILAGALAGFLRHNFHPASIFLGDSGSQFIGYVLAVTAITDVQKAANTLPVIIPLLVFGLPIFDTILSMFRRVFKDRAAGQVHEVTLRERILSTKRIFLPDRDHVHHRLLTMGFSHRSAVLTLYALASALSLLALISVVARYRNTGAILLTAIIVIYLGLRKLGYKRVAFLKTATVLRWSERILRARLSFHAVMDLILIAAAYWGAFILKYDGLWAPDDTNWYLVMFPFVFTLQMCVFFGLGLYQGIGRARGISDLSALSFAAGIAVLLSYVVAAIYEPPSGILTFFGINAVLLQILLLGGRSTYKILVHLGRRDSVTQGPRVIIYGAGRRGQSILQELMENRALGLHPIGFLDDDLSLIGFTINRVRILGCGRHLPSILDSHKVSALIISSHKITAERLVPVMTICSKLRIPVLRGEFQLDRVSRVWLSGARDASDEREQSPTAPEKINAPGDSPVMKVSSG
jgi:UDP-GlcNAc:undecaprenyl-phosphate/decaprenyl-phosphate GlcNAc-1-phosphate transferase